MTDAVQAAREAKVAADLALKEAKDARERAFDVIRDEHRPLIAAAERAASQAATALKAAISQACPDHELEGKTVYRIARKIGRYGSTPKDTLLAGVVFTYRPGIDLGPGWSFSRPHIGEPMVRLLLKNGKPGSKCQRLNKFTLDRETTPNWSLDKDNAPVVS